MMNRNKLPQNLLNASDRERRRQTARRPRTVLNVRRRRGAGKGKADGEGSAPPESHHGSASGTSEAPLKKRRLVNGEELVFKRPTEDDDEQDQAVDASEPKQLDVSSQQSGNVLEEMPVSTTAAPRIIIHEDD